MTTGGSLDEKSICLQLVARCERQPGQMLILIRDKNFRGTQFEADLAALDAKILRPRRKDERGRGLHLAPIRQRIESIFWTAKDSVSNATARARCTTCSGAWPCASPPSPPSPRSTTNSDAPAARIACYTT
jgi:hypothetical protein